MKPLAATAKLILCLAATTLASCRIGYELYDLPSTHDGGQSGNGGQPRVTGRAGPGRDAGGAHETNEGSASGGELGALPRGAGMGGDNAAPTGTSGIGGAAANTDSGGMRAVGGAQAAGADTAALIGGNAGSSNGTSAMGGLPSYGGTSSAGSGTTTGGTMTNAGASSTAAAAGTAGVSSSAGAAGTAGSAGVSSTVGGADTAGAAGVPNSAGAAGAAGATGTEFDPASKSCEGLATQCQSQSCCTSIAVPQASFEMGRGEDPAASDYYIDGSASEVPEHDATVSAFALDKYEVTVARFRQFVLAYDQWHATDGHPSNGEGSHPNASNTGWDSAWNTPDSSDLPADASTLKSNLNCSSGNWTRNAGANEPNPINCVNWYEAWAFCIWDGGRLPTEAEWELVAAGGARNQLYPWGNADPDASRANYDATNNAPDVPAGSMGPTGAGYWGHQDLGGSMWEWVFDWFSDTYYATLPSPGGCVDCANAAGGSYRVSRGSAWDYTTHFLRSAARGYFMPSSRGGGMGFRCARAAP